MTTENPERKSQATIFIENYAGKNGNLKSLMERYSRGEISREEAEQQLFSEMGTALNTIDAANRGIEK